MLSHSICKVVTREYEDFIHTLVQDMDSSGYAHMLMGILNSPSLARILLPSDKIMAVIIGMGLISFIAHFTESSFSHWESFEQIFFWKLLFSACYKLGRNGHSHRILKLCRQLLPVLKQCSKDTSEFLDGIILLVMGMYEMINDPKDIFLLTKPLVNGDDRYFYIASFLEKITTSLDIPPSKE